MRPARKFSNKIAVCICFFLIIIITCKSYSLAVSINSTNETNIFKTAFDGATKSPVVIETGEVLTNSTVKNDKGTMGTYAALKSGQLGPLTKCSMSEFTCTNSNCIPVNKFCDKANDCGDNSDEPRYCTRKYINNNV